MKTKTQRWICWNGKQTKYLVQILGTVHPAEKARKATRKSYRFIYKEPSRAVRLRRSQIVLVLRQCSQEKPFSRLR